MKKGIMTLLDNVNISAMMNDKGKLLSLGIDKSRDLAKRKHELTNSFLKTLLGVISNITFNPLTLSLGIQFGQSITSKSFKDKRTWNV
jgi:hypothetical protein